MTYFVAAVVDTSSSSSSGKPSGRAVCGYSTTSEGGHSCVRPISYESWPMDTWSMASAELCAIASALGSILMLPVCDVE
eukprot:5757213-Amphidinium_carterae.2